ncbi:MAG: DUF721 domain-containing protein [Ilumatobacteraceae bacterium]
MAEPVPISQSLDSIMKSLRGTDRIQIGGVFGRWDDAVGETVAAHVRPVRLDQGVLTVEADEPAWATQVKFLSSTIAARLAEVAGVTVERIEVRVGRSSPTR